MRSVVFVVVVSLVLFCGCATRGRLSVLDLDLRDKEQIIAYEPEAVCIYFCQGEDAALKSDVSGESPWFFIFDFLKIMKGRIRIGSFEWVK